MSKKLTPENFPTAIKDKYIDDLSKYTKVQLLEMRDRQLKLMANKSRLAKLPDKGERIQKLYENIMQEINARNVIDKAAELFSELNIVEKGVKTLTHMEWTGGKMNGDQILVAADTLNSDNDEDDEFDPLKIIAQSRETKLVKVVKSPKSLITAADLADIKSMNNETNNDDTNKTGDSVELEPHAIYMIKMDKAFDPNAKIKQKFLPFRTTKGDAHNIEKEKQRKHGKHWEVTSATPPNLRNNAVKLITLHESIEMEKQHQEKLREQLEKHAEERLAIRKKIIADNISLLPSGSALLDPNSFFQSYRQRNVHFDENADSDGGESDDNDDVYSDNDIDLLT
ncbi:uncharacterized protein LOC116339822 [Contarinia nasturtii]|uniref:uncharacterized protein LOC116339822 n=1 Tax=Contarinia nasturtii TaxID=265458 RepID=UPI0012D43E52|nr:uncharacterized protein LOC116339822 [Contarinia nasturtii]